MSMDCGLCSIYVWAIDKSEVGGTYERDTSQPQVTMKPENDAFD